MESSWNCEELAEEARRMQAKESQAGSHATLTKMHVATRRSPPTLYTRQMHQLFCPDPCLAVLPNGYLVDSEPRMPTLPALPARRRD